MHIGKIIQEQAKFKGMNDTELAKRINKSKSAVGKMFKQSSINTDTLLKLCEVLEYNFFECFLKETKNNNPIKMQIEVEITREELRKWGL